MLAHARGGTFVNLPPGWTFQRWLKESARFNSSEVLGPDGLTYFMKVVSPKADHTALPLLRSYIGNEIAFNTQYRKQMVLTLPKIYQSSPTGYIGERLTGEPLGELAHTTATSLVPYLGTLVNVVEELYRLPVLDSVRTQPIDLASELLTSSWLEDARKLYTQGLFDHTLEGIRDLQHALVRGVTHGGLTWEHVFRLDDGSYGLVDTERAGTKHSRLYDLAYLYVRIYTYTGCRDQADYVLREAFGRLGLTRHQFIAEMLPTLMERLVGVHADAWRDLNSKTGEARDYRRQVQELTYLILGGDVFDCIP